MASGKEHSNGLIVFSLVVLLASIGFNALVLHENPWKLINPVEAFRIGFTGLIVSFGVLSGLWFNPDLDYAEHPEYKVEPVKKWGPLGVIWVPYGFVLNHRSPFSHLPIISDAIRVIYFGAILYGLSFAPILENWINQNWLFYGFIYDQNFWYWFFGLCMATTLHYWQDKPKKKHKKRIRKKVRKRIYY